MKIVDSKDKKIPFKSAKTHARLKHDYATWHEEHEDQIMRKTSLKLPFQNKSKFDSFEVFRDVLKESRKYPAIVAKNGNQVTVFDIGYIAGYDARSKRQTSTVTLVTTPDGEVITAYPGTPWASDRSG